MKYPACRGAPAPDMPDRGRLVQWSPERARAESHHETVMACPITVSRNRSGNQLLTLVLRSGGGEGLRNGLADVLGQVVEGNRDRLAGRAVGEFGGARRQ